jgi:hypothetical protein
LSACSLPNKYEPRSTPAIDKAGPSRGADGHPSRLQKGIHAENEQFTFGFRNAILGLLSLSGMETAYGLLKMTVKPRHPDGAAKKR